MGKRYSRRTTVKSLPDWKNLSLKEQVAQMVVVRASGYLFDHQIQYPAWEASAQQLQFWLQDLGVGGVILLGGSTAELALRSQQLQELAKAPLLIAADIEEGVGQRFTGATWFPPPMAVGSLAQQNLAQAQFYAEQMGAITAQEALAIGINWLLAPVVDVNNNPQNPVINIRSFAETPEIVSQLACAFIRGAQHYQVLTTAKHFPGHGDTATDSHLDLPVILHSESRLQQVELPPFRAAIASGVDAIMSAHLLVRAWDNQHPATLSKQILTNLLRNSLEFEGLIVTDALVMGAITNSYGAEFASVMAVEAGADILLMPTDPESTIEAVCEAVLAGRLSRERIQASLERIWKAKAKVIIAQQEQRKRLEASEHQYFVTNSLSQLAQPAALATAASILQDSQLSGGALPLPPESINSQRQLRNLIVVDDALVCDFLRRNSPALLLPSQKGYELQLIDCHTPTPLAAIDDAVGTRITLLQLFIRGNPFRGSAGFTPIAENLLKRLLKKEILQAIIIYGSPYALKRFLPELPPETPYVFSYGQMPKAQEVALEVLFSPSTSVNTFTYFL
ncbi:MAG: beta-glucosidase [Symploca sp. SIO2B6]|nr:beta-glucosidase [Symploca sp. SIO2B6]